MVVFAVVSAVCNISLVALFVYTGSRNAVFVFITCAVFTLEYSVTAVSAFAFRLTVRAAAVVASVLISVIASFVCARSLNTAFVFITCAVFTLEDSVAAVSAFAVA